MKMKLLFLVTFFLLNATAHAQKITGTVCDDTSVPITYATVILCNAVDTTQVAYTITDNLGNFSLTAKKPGNFLLQISCIGYKPQFLLPKEGLHVVLKQDVTKLDEVVINATRPISKVTAQGVQTMIANTALSDMGTSNDVLKRIPMISGDNGSFKVFGRGTAKTYINNREIRDPSELDNLNSTEIQSIEVISNPGAKYDALCKAVINIKTKKKQGDGFSLNTRSSFYTWDNQDYINQVSANYRHGGLDVFANIYHSDTRSYQKGTISQIVSIDTLWNQHNNMLSDMHIKKVNASMGINYQITDKHSLGFRYDLKSSLGENIQDLHMSSKIYANDELYDDVANHEYQRTRNKPKSRVNLYYYGEIEKLKIDFDSDFLINNDEINSVNTETSQGFANNTIVSNSTINNEIYAAKLQLVYPIWKGELMIGSEYVHLKRGDDYTNFTLDSSSSHVSLSENKLSLFALYNLAFERIGSFSFGLRYENDRYDYYVDDEKDFEKSRSYQQFFPNLSFSSQVGEVKLKLGYDTKVTRPRYNQLGTSLLYGNRFTLLSGNPYLKPTLSNNISFMSVWKFVQAQVNYSYQKDVITMWADRYKDDPKITVMTYRNLERVQKLAAFVGLSYRWGPWKPLLELGFQKQWLDLNEYGIERRMNHPIYTVSLSNIFELKNGCVFNLDARYKSKGDYQTSYAYKDFYELNFGVSKRFFNDALQIKLSASDIFNQKVEAYQTYSPQTYMKTLFHYDTRNVSLSVRFYFNSTKSRYKGKGAGKSEINRL